MTTWQLELCYRCFGRWLRDATSPEVGILSAEDSETRHAAWRKATAEWLAKAQLGAAVTP